MRIFLSTVVMVSLLLLTNSAGAKEFYWPMFLPAITKKSQPPPPPPPPPNLPPETVFSAGRIWMDRNLGASRVATSSTDTSAYGDLYQWGRLRDGHEKRTSATTWTRSPRDVPGHGMFIMMHLTFPPVIPSDWRIPQNDQLWQGVSGINNPCPSGFRLPTKDEWGIESASWSSQSAAGAFASPLRLVTAGWRDYEDGKVIVAGSWGSYWASSTTGIFSYYLDFHASNAFVSYGSRAFGSSVRCIME